MERARKMPLTITWVAPRDGLVLKRTPVEGMKRQRPGGLCRLRFSSVARCSPM